LTRDIVAVHLVVEIAQGGLDPSWWTPCWLTATAPPTWGSSPSAWPSLPLMASRIVVALWLPVCHIPGRLRRANVWAMPLRSTVGRRRESRGDGGRGLCLPRTPYL